LPVEEIRLGIIGCGAVAEHFHLPAAKECLGVKVAALVDKNLKRSRILSEQFNVPFYTDDFTQLYDKVDGVIVALPHYLHAPVSIEFLKRGIAVLVEKPMAITKEECQAMMLATESTTAVLAVGHYRRFAANILRLKKIVTAGMLGIPLRYVCEEGLPYDWPSQTGFVFKRAQAGGGVLIDAGVHSIDWLLWLFGEPYKFEYADDNFGGVEANCFCQFFHKNQIQGILELSRTRTLSNRLTVYGSKATVAMSVWSPDDWHVLEGNLPPEFATPPVAPEGIKGMFKAQLLNFAAAIQNKQPIMVDDTLGERAVKWVQQCYMTAKRLDLPWLRGKRYGITGR